MNTTIARNRKIELDEMNFVQQTNTRGNHSSSEFHRTTVDIRAKVNQSGLEYASNMKVEGVRQHRPSAVAPT